MQRPNLQVLQSKMTDAAAFTAEYTGDEFDWEYELGRHYMIEWCDHEFRPAARIYHRARPTNAYYVLDVSGPKPGFLSDALWERAKEMQRREDAKDF